MGALYFRDESELFFTFFKFIFVISRTEFIVKGKSKCK